MTSKKMAPLAESPPGLEQDSKGNSIPLDQRTRDDKEKVLSNLVEKMHADASIKNPEGEAQTPARMPDSQKSQGGPARAADLEGNQGSSRH